jgi:hypothetical protein
MKRWQRILLVLGVVAGLCVVYGWFFGVQTLMVWRTHSLARSSPFVNQTPGPLPDTSVSVAKGTAFSYFGYDFEVPWDDLDSAKTKVFSNRVALVFRSEKLLIFSKAPPRHFVDSMFQETATKEFWRKAYGDAAVESDYAMWRLILEATPDKVTIFSPRREVIGNSTLVMMKAIALPENSGMFALYTEHFRGFQWGDPGKSPRHVVADLFADDCGLEFVFSGISQAEINRVLQSVHRKQETSVR